MNLLTSYKVLLELSCQMVELARRQDWESLASTEMQRASLTASLPATLPALSATDYASITAIIHQILSCDSEILEYVTPWREHAATLLSRLAPSR